MTLAPTITLVLLAGTAHADPGELAATDDRYERLMIETALGGGPEHETAYTQRLEDFGFDPGLRLFEGVFMLEGSVVYSASRNLSAVLTVGNIDSDSYHRDMLQVGDQDFDEYFRWTTWRAGAYARYSLPLIDGWLVPYLQGGGGPAMALSTYTDEHCERQERQLGWHLAGAAGLQLMPDFGGHRHVGIYTQIETSYAPVLDNLTGDTHDSGRRALMFGVRAGY